MKRFILKDSGLKSITEHGRNCLLVNVIKYMVTVLRKMEIIFWESENNVTIVFENMELRKRQVRTV